METNTCQCGCGETVKNRFKPGHDSRLKSNLVQAVSSKNWWEREAAVQALTNLGWLHFTSAEALAAVQVRSRAKANGRFTETRHAHVVHNADWSHLDENGVTHSHPECPDTQGNLTAERQVTGWLCSTCVHTTDHLQTAAAHRLEQWETKTAGTVLEWHEGRTAELVSA